MDEDGVPLSEDNLDAAALSGSSSEFELEEDDTDSAYSATPEDEDWSTEVKEGRIQPHSLTTVAEQATADAQQPGQQSAEGERGQRRRQRGGRVE